MYQPTNQLWERKEQNKARKRTNSQTQTSKPDTPSFPRSVVSIGIKRACRADRTEIDCRIVGERVKEGTGVFFRESAKQDKGEERSHDRATALFVSFCVLDL